MTRAPLSSPNLMRFRDTADSGRFNEHTDEVFHDLLEIYNFSNEQEAELKRMQEFFEVGSHFAQEQTDQMEKELNQLREELEAVRQPGKECVKLLLPADMRPDRTSDAFEQALIDTQHDVLTLPSSSFSSSKLYFYDDINKEYVMPNTLTYDVLPKADGLVVKENDLMAALSPDGFSFWHRKYTYAAGLKDQVEAQVIIKLPETIITNRDVNTIYIHPFPLNTMDIVNVEYQLNGGWTPVPGFQPVENAGNVKYSFSPIEVSSVRITLRQRHFISKGTQQIFHMGLREIGIFHNDYQMGVGRFEIPVEFHSVFTNKEITRIEPLYFNEETLSIHQKQSRLATFRIYEVDAAGNENYVNDTFPVQVKASRILLKGTISYDHTTRAAPTLTGVALYYKGDS